VIIYMRLAMSFEKQFIWDIHLTQDSLMREPLPHYQKGNFSFGNLSLDLICKNPAYHTQHLFYEENQSVGAFLDGYLLSDADQSERLGELIQEYVHNGKTLTEVKNGIYNLIVFDAEACAVEIYNDTFGNFPCYYITLPHHLIITNSLMLLKHHISLTTDPHGFAEHYALTHVIGERTVFDRVCRTSPGSGYHFNLGQSIEVKQRRLATTWTRADQPKLQHLLDELGDMWEIALNRYLRNVSEPVGLMLSGGLDSRLVLGGLMSRHIPVIVCTHGDADSAEVQIARRISQLLGIEHVVNPMNAGFSFDQLSLQEVLWGTDLIFNPIWKSSVEKLVKRDVRHIVSGEFGDTLIGGSYYQFDSNHKRIMLSVQLNLGFPIQYDMLASEESIEQTATLMLHNAAHRLKYYKFLLRKEYQNICQDQISRIKDNVRQVLHSYLQGVQQVRQQQLVERFNYEHRERKYVLGQELILRMFAKPVMPIANREWAHKLTNIDSRLKHDHYLYYRFFNKVYPDLGRFEVPNLYGSIARPQLLIEMRRVFRRMMHKRNAKKRGWTNFNDWITSDPGRLAQYRNEFLKVDTVFDPDAVNSFFDAVQRGERFLYDGNETLNFLTAASLIESVG
jgi:asparagine synthetase B (glutamine-hydrolysing)